MGAIKQRLILSFELSDDDELSIDYQLDPKTCDVPQTGREYDLHLVALTCCDAAYKTMKESFK